MFEIEKSKLQNEVEILQDKCSALHAKNLELEGIILREQQIQDVASTLTDIEAVRHECNIALDAEKQINEKLQEIISKSIEKISNLSAQLEAEKKSNELLRKSYETGICNRGENQSKMTKWSKTVSSKSPLIFPGKTLPMTLNMHCCITVLRCYQFFF